MKVTIWNVEHFFPIFWSICCIFSFGQKLVVLSETPKKSSVIKSFPESLIFKQKSMCPKCMLCITNKISFCKKVNISVRVESIKWLLYMELQRLFCKSVNFFKFYHFTEFWIYVREVLKGVNRYSRSSKLVAGISK